MYLCVNLREIVLFIDSMGSTTLKAIELYIWLWRREQTEVWKFEKKQSQIIATISQQHVGYDEQWSVLEIAARIKDIKDNIYV